MNSLPWGQGRVFDQRFAIGPDPAGLCPDSIPDVQVLCGAHGGRMIGRRGFEMRPEIMIRVQ